MPDIGIPHMNWNYLLVDDMTPEQASDCLDPWRPLIGGRISPIFMSRFGFWFFLRPNGHVDGLDVFSGYVSEIAESHDDFVRLVNSPDWQDCYLFPALVAKLHEEKVVPGPGQCFALGAHPAKGGPNPANGDTVDPKTVMVMDAPIWQSICAQMTGVGA